MPDSNNMLSGSALGISLSSALSLPTDLLKLTLGYFDGTNLPKE